MKTNNIKPIRFTPELMKEVRKKAPHIKGNFSAQVKYLIQLGVAKSEGKNTYLREQPLELEELKYAIHQANIKLALIGNRMNEITHHLSRGDSSNSNHLLELSKELKNEIALVRKITSDTVRQL